MGQSAFGGVQAGFEGSSSGVAPCGQLLVLSLLPASAAALHRGRGGRAQRQVPGRLSRAGHRSCAARSSTPGHRCRPGCLPGVRSTRRPCRWPSATRGAGAPAARRGCQHEGHEETTDGGRSGARRPISPAVDDGMGSQTLGHPRSTCLTATSAAWCLRICTDGLAAFLLSLRWTIIFAPADTGAPANPRLAPHESACPLFGKGRLRRLDKDRQRTRRLEVRPYQGRSWFDPIGREVQTRHTSLGQTGWSGLFVKSEELE